MVQQAAVARVGSDVAATSDKGPLQATGEQGGASGNDAMESGDDAGGRAECVEKPESPGAPESPRAAVVTAADATGSARAQNQGAEDEAGRGSKGEAAEAATEAESEAEKEQLANEGKRREGKGAGMAQRKVTARMTKKPRKKRKVRAARTYLVDGTLKLQSGMTIVGPDGKLRTIAQVSPASTGVGTAAAAVPKDTGWIRD